MRSSNYSILAAGALVLMIGCRPEAAKKSEPPLQTVDYVQPSRQDVREFEEFTGRAWPSESVEVRARVSGYLQEVHFTDGAKVAKDEELAKIDDRSFKFQVVQADAALRMTKARIARVTKQIARAENLIQSGSVTEEDFELLLSERNQAEASSDAAQAALDIAKLNEEFTTVQSPISGWISRRLVDPGNLVTADQTLLATIVADDPIHVYFDIDERTVLRINRRIRDEKLGRDAANRVQVEIALADEIDFKHIGKVDFFDNQLDAATGTQRFRAEVENENRFITPGMFVRLRFPMGEPESRLLVPEEAIASDQGEQSVFVVVVDPKDGEVVQSRPVKTGILVNGMRVITSGIEGKERVVVSGLQRVRNGSKVVPKDRNAKESAQEQVAKSEK